jgi:hypothetical protein
MDKNSGWKIFQSSYKQELSTSDSVKSFELLGDGACTHRPAEDEGHNELAIGTVRVCESEGAAAQYGAGSIAEGTWAGGGHVALVLLEADAEERATGSRARNRTVGTSFRPTACTRRQFAPVVGDLQDLKLEEARPACALQQETQKEVTLTSYPNLLYSMGIHCMSKEYNPRGRARRRKRNTVSGGITGSPVTRGHNTGTWSSRLRFERKAEDMLCIFVVAKSK